MTQKMRSIVFPLCLISADIWNLFCLFQVIAFDRWRFSFAIAGIGSLTVLIPQLMASRKDHSGSPKPTAKDKGLAGVSIAALAFLIITWVACLVYPL